MTDIARSIIFAGCVRNCAAHLAAVLENCTRLSAMAVSPFFLFAENDSTDATKALLKEWCATRDNAEILCFDGLDVAMPKRTQRLAFLRNRILETVRERGLADCDAICFLDFDEVNAGQIDRRGFAAALDFLFSDMANAGVFAVSDPVYYDVYALRRVGWCEADCWEEIRKKPAADRLAAFEDLVCSRQVPIAQDHLPIAVTSAFGGLGIYRLEYAIDGSYEGLNESGEEVCEHISFNTAIVARGGRLFIFPRLRNQTPWEHCLGNRKQKTMQFSNGTVGIRLAAPSSHMLDHYLKQNPLYDRRLPLLLAVFNRYCGRASVLDIGANILDTIALMCVSGVQLSRSISVDASLEFYKYAQFNLQQNAAVFGEAEVRWGFVGSDDDRGNIIAQNGTGNVRALHTQIIDDLLNPPLVTFRDLAPDGCDLVKIDVDGYDHIVIRSNMTWLKQWQPIIWAEAQIDDGFAVSSWATVLDQLRDDFPYVAVFDNFGFCLCTGDLEQKSNVVLELIDIAARYRKHEGRLGQPRIYYVDVLFVPRRHKPIFDAFVEQLPEASGATDQTAHRLLQTHPVMKFT